jgi:hypothetical protein
LTFPDAFAGKTYRQIIFFWCVSLLFVSDLADAGRDKMGGVSLRISTLSSVNYLGDIYSSIID